MTAWKSKKNKKLGRTRAGTPGFSLLETMVAMAMGGIIVAVASSSVAMINKQIYYVIKSSSIDDDVKHIEEYISSQIQEAGGGVVKAGQAIRVYQTPGISDVLVITQRHETLVMECQVESISGTDIHLAREDVDGDGVFETCCLDAIPEHSELMVIPANGRSVSFLLEDKHTGPSECYIEETEWSPLDSGHEAELTADLTAALLSGGLIGGSVTVVQRIRFDVDATSKLMKARWLEEGVAKSQTVTDRVYDFQVALGYDSIDGNGIILDTGNASDEWIGNHSGDNMALIGAADEDLRLVTVGVVLVTNQLGKNESHRLLDGPLIAPGDSIVRHGRTTVGVRNTNTFE